MSKKTWHASLVNDMWQQLAHQSAYSLSTVSAIDFFFIQVPSLQESGIAHNKKQIAQNIQYNLQIKKLAKNFTNQISLKTGYDIQNIFKQIGYS